MLRCAMLARGALAACAALRQARAQSPEAHDSVHIAPGWDVAQFQERDAPLRFTLDRPLRASDGRLAAIVGHTDLSALLDIRGMQVLLPLRGLRISSGAVQVSVYLITDDDSWARIGEFTLNRLTRAGLESARARPSLSLQSDGQLDAGHPADAPPNGRGRTYQDVALNAGIESALSRSGSSLDIQGLVMGATRASARLRAQQLGERAPAVDLASYTLRFARSGLSVAAGHLALGNERHLVNQFRSRGISAELQPTRALQLSVGVVAGSELVGWSDPLGLSRPSHRVIVGSLGLEMIPSRPGAIRLDLSSLAGSLQPVPAVNQQTITDREQSRGFAWQLSATDPSQRVRFATGLARSRFENPVDPALSGTSVLVPVRAESRAARFGELSLAVVRDARIGAVGANLSIAARHERIDPQYRSVAVPLQADRVQDGLEATGNLDAVQLQYTATRGRDNLDQIRSLLTTESRGQSLSLGIPLAQLVRASAERAWWWPQLAAAWQATWQVGDAPPEDAGFRFSFQVPDQRTDNLTASASWQRSGWSVVWHYAYSSVENRQAEGARPDVITSVLGATVGVNASSRLTLGLDLSTDAQRVAGSGVQARNQRLGAQADWRPTSTSTVIAAFSSAIADDRTSTRRGRNGETRLELSQGVRLNRHSTDGSQLRAFLRYARTDAALRLADRLQPTLRSWTLNSGLSLRLF